MSAVLRLNAGRGMGGERRGKKRKGAVGELSEQELARGEGSAAK